MKAIHKIAVRVKAIHKIAVRVKAIHKIAVRVIAIRVKAIHNIAVRVKAIHKIAVRVIAIRVKAIHKIAVRVIAIRVKAIHKIAIRIVASHKTVSLIHCVIVFSLYFQTLGQYTPRGNTGAAYDNAGYAARGKQQQWPATRYYDQDPRFNRPYGHFGQSRDDQYVLCFFLFYIVCVSSHCLCHLPHHPYILEY